jgi:hypothetical protein
MDGRIPLRYVDEEHTPAKTRYALEGLLGA